MPSHPEEEAAGPRPVAPVPAAAAPGSGQEPGAGHPGPETSTPASPGPAPFDTNGRPRREPGAGYAAAARVLSLLPPVPSGEAPPEPPGLPGLDAAGLRRAGLDRLLPGGPAGLALPLAMALLRPDVRRWLGAEGLAGIAGLLGLREKEAAVQLDGMPLPPAPLGEASRWSGRQVPLLRADGGLSWLEVFWRPDRPPRARRGRAAGRSQDRCALALRLVLPATGRVDLRGRLEDDRLDAVMETALPLPRATTADLVDGFDAVLRLLRLQGSLTVRHTAQDRGT
jgi:hypothetical protein